MASRPPNAGYPSRSGARGGRGSRSALPARHSANPLRAHRAARPNMRMAIFG